MSEEFFARSASDNTDDWPYWYIAKTSNPRLNVTSEVVKILGLPEEPGAVFFPGPLIAKRIAEAANRKVRGEKT